MLVWAFIFLFIAIISGLFGFKKIESSSTNIGKILFILFLTLFVIALIWSLISVEEGTSYIP